MTHYKTETLDLRLMDCMDALRDMPDNSVDAIVTDPPYYKVVDSDWDKQWKTREDFLNWLESMAIEWRRVLKPNGSLYVFCYSTQSARIEVMLEKHFNILNQIVWAKPTGYWAKQCKEEQRIYFPATERIIFAEHYGADNMAKGESGWVAKCDKLRGFVFEPLRSYLVAEKEKSGLTNNQLLKLSSTFHTHYWGRSQWALPTEKDYNAFRKACNKIAFLREYEDLRREYEDLRRPFDIVSLRHTTDVWTYATEQGEIGRHPCQKPIALMDQIILSSTKRGDLIFDPFSGSGSTAISALKNGRRFVGTELDPHYFSESIERITRETAQFELPLSISP